MIVMRRLTALLREVAWLPVTWWKVRQDASLDPHGNLLSDRGWPYRLPIVAPNMNDPKIAAAVKAGAIRDDSARQLTTAATGAGSHHAAKEG